MDSPIDFSLIHPITNSFAGMKREYSMLTRAQLETGKLAEGGRGVKMCKNVGLGSSSDQIVTIIARGNADSPAQVGAGGQPGVRKSAQEVKGLSREKSQGKLTKNIKPEPFTRNLRMHRLVFTKDVLRDGEELHYVVGGMERLKGFKKDGGIYCSCCDSVVSASQFEVHAGYESRRKPYDNIFTSKGLSLHNLAVDMSKKLKSEENDDLCFICKDRGDMLCCKTCPRACHVECVGLTSVFQETWYCGYCQDMLKKANLEEQSANAIAAGRIPGSDPLKEITRRCIRIVETLPDIGGCAICSDHDFTMKAFNDRTVIICDQCEKEYHVGCLREKQMADLKAVPEGDWFCCKQCNNINFMLQKWIDMGDLFLPEDFLKKKAAEQVSDLKYELDIKWRLLNGRATKDTSDTGKLLDDAFSIFQNRIAPNADSTTASIDLIPHLVYGRSFRGQDYGGMHCAIFMVNSVVVSAAIFRVFGEGVAEIPLVATKRDCERKGYFQSLFFCIMGLLASLNVKNVVLPAADEAESFWKDKFGFTKLDPEQVYNYKKHHRLLNIFNETSILHKSITKFEV